MTDPHYADDWLTIYLGDCRTVLASLPDASVHCVVTSPPYWGLRDYGTATWDGGEATCDHRIETAHQKQGATSQRAGRSNTESQRNENFRSTCGKCGARRIDAQLGLEPTPEEYVANMVAVFREVRRVLRDDGTLWLNLGDSYAATRAGAAYGWTNGKTSDRDAETMAAYKTVGLPPGLKPKDLVGIPWRVAFALQADGWYLRSDIIWSKPNPMPESVTDRPTKAHEYLFLLSKSARYYYDADAVRERAESGPSDLRKMAEGRERIGGLVKEQTDPKLAASGLTNIGRRRSVGGKQLASAETRPDGMGRRMPGFNGRWDVSEDAGIAPAGRNLRTVWTIATQPYPGAHFATFPRKLVEPCVKAGCPEGGTVLDPFAGSGTTAMVANALSRRAILIDLSADYLGQAMERNRDVPLGL